MLETRWLSTKLREKHFDADWPGAVDDAASDRDLVNYNAGDELAVALRSIQRDCARVPWEAVVVDNASSDDSAAVVETFPQATLIRNPANVGFGRAVNQAAAARRGTPAAADQSGLSIDLRALSTLRSVLDAEPSCAVVGPRILDPDGKVQEAHAVIRTC